MHALGSALPLPFTTFPTLQRHLTGPCRCLLPQRTQSFFRRPPDRQVAAKASRDSGQIIQGPGILLWTSEILEQLLERVVDGLTGSEKASDPGTDLAVFQFTLGIPGFDDALVPRIVGAAVIVLLVINHLAASNPAPAQVSLES